ncbi:hypothetical protein F0365_00285 [Nonlabens sp. Ci31]|jgi:hypothetical protein|uniref:hypothetical protein n=1 Tax=Nonlabens sp. Ci31 TaxID=2608253 RepID=UPI001462D9CB|nr:hypothetical protein [Nonlabens sp. Ci31]QJP32956.1 hypothetical protein F0365_00285 [Nonlabens sp. Ci31]
MSSKLNQQLAEVTSFIKKGDQLNLKVSDKGTYWHLDHSLQVLNGISETLTNSNPEDYQPKFSLPKFIIMNTGFIPRGKGRAPKQTIPEGGISEEKLLSDLDKIKNATKDLNNLAENKNFKHPLFGYLNRMDTIKFMAIHTQHHLKIMRDIVK